jgi:phage N-6-adenine-methyltransferase
MKPIEVNEEKLAEARERSINNCNDRPRWPPGGHGPMLPSINEQARGKWATPQDFFDAANAMFDFQIDLAATAENTKCEEFISPEEDSLAQDVAWIWTNTALGCGHFRCWLNPPFSNIKDWIEKAYNEAQKDERAVIVVLCRVAPSARWWMKYVTRADEVLLIGGKRVQFIPPKGIKKSSNPQECCLVVFRQNPCNNDPVISTWDWLTKRSSERSV